MPRKARGSHIRGSHYALSLLALVLVLGACGSARTTSQRPTATATSGGAPTAPTAGETDWPTWGYDPARSEQNSQETTLTRGNVAGLHRLWVAKLPGVADGEPILLHGLTMPDGTQRDLLFLTTRAGTLVAVDAGSGAVIWTAATSGPRYTTSSPVADPSRQFVYSYGLDAKLHKYAATTGHEVTSAPWPVTITTMPDSEKQSSSLNAANGFVYVTTAGYPGDAPPYQGHVVAVDLQSGAVHVFNALCSTIVHVLAPGECSANQAGLWTRAGVVVDPTSGDVYTTTGNGPYDGQHEWGNTVLELAPGAARLRDTYTPPNYAALNDGDTDLGSAAPALLPRLSGTSTPLLAVQASKDGLLRLLNRQDLSGHGGPGHLGGELQRIATPGGCAVFTQPAVWTDPAGQVWVLVSDGCGTAGYQLTSNNGASRLRQAWSIGQGATSPVVAHGVLYAATSNTVFALDPASGRQLWSSAQTSAGGSIGAVHWESPIVVNGRVYCSDEDGQVSAYGL
jgi:outer membrane protein assembly factor BamB